MENKTTSERDDGELGMAFRPNAKFWDLKPTDILDDMPFVFPRFRRSTAGFLLGANGAGKSMFALALAMGLAGGVSFLGPQFKPTAPRRTVYVTSGEDISDLQVRMSAIRHFSMGADQCDFECVSRNCAVYSLSPSAMRSEALPEHLADGASRRSDVTYRLRRAMQNFHEERFANTDTGLARIAKWLPVLLSDTDLVILDLKPDRFWTIEPQTEFCQALFELSDRAAGGSQSAVLLVLQDSYRSAFEPHRAFPAGLDFCEFYNKSFGARLEVVPRGFKDNSDIICCSFKPAMYFEDLRPCRYERRFFGVLYPEDRHCAENEGGDTDGRALE